MVHGVFVVGITREEQGLFEEAQRLLYRARPRTFMERYLWVQHPERGLVRLAYNENQRYFYRETFWRLGSWEQPLNVLELKDRKATWSTWVKGVMFSYLFIPGFHAISTADSDDTFKSANQMLDRFFDNLPAWMKPVKRHWDTEFKEVDWGTTTSSITMSSSRSPNFGRGFTPKMWDADEAGWYSSTFEDRVYTSIMNSLPNNAWVLKGGTPRKLGEGGRPTRFYIDFMDIEKGESSAKLLFRRWPDNRENALPQGHSRARPHDVGEIEVGQAGGLIGEDQEPELVKTFPQDGVAFEDRLRWRRAMIAEAIAAKSKDANAGFATFLQEHTEDKHSCWINAVNPQFDPILLKEMMDSAPKRPIEQSTVSGFTFRAWQRPIPGHVYCAGLDLSTGHARDSSSLQVLDCTTGVFVAELHGKPSPDITVAETVKVMERFYYLLLGAERTGTGEGIIPMIRAIPGMRVWRRKAKPGENPDTDSFRSRPYGTSTDSTTRGPMFAKLQAMINTGQVRSLNPELIEAWQSFDPDVDDHWPDRLSGSVHAINVMEDAIASGVRVGGLGRGHEPRGQRITVLSGTGPGSGWRVR